MSGRLERLFPNLIPVMRGWPAGKWLALPVVAFFAYGIILGLSEATLDEFGWYDERRAAGTGYDLPEDHSK